MLRLSVAAILLSLVGCDLYWDDTDPQPPPPPPCYGYGGPEGGAPRPDMRNPYTGQCEYGGGGGCYETGDGCGCYPYDTAGSGAGSGTVDAGTTTGSGSGGGGMGSGGTAPDIAQWPTCYGPCSNLDETSCLADSSCHAAYVTDSRKDDPSPTPAGYGVAFMGCWDIAPLPIVSGSCDGLDAYSCAMHNDCAGYFDTNYAPDDGGYYYFSYCGAETPAPTCALIDCEIGTHCEESCYGDCGTGTPDPNTGMCESLQCYPMCVPDYDYSCATVDCGPGYECVEQCDGGGMDPSDPTTGGGTSPPGYCYPTCVEIVNAPGECYGDVWCDALPPACPANTTAGVANGCYTGYCIPVSDCGPQDPGSCEPASSTCTVTPPSCPSGTTAGVKNSCYTGYCIPDSSCPQVPCEALTTEASCLGRMECTPVYTGDNCTCDANGVCHDCTSQSFDRCETWVF